MPPPGETNITILGFFALVVLGLLTFVVPRKLAPAPLIIMVCYMTLGQVINVFGLHFYLIRVLVLFGWMRLFLRGELRRIRLGPIDKAFICWALTSFLIYNIRERSGEALIRELGFLYNTFGIFFLFRMLITDGDEVDRTFKILATVMVPLALAILMEADTARNIFSIFGGVPEVTALRDDKLRCQCPFRSPILAGTFGATALPLFVGLWVKDRGNRLFAAAGVVSATIITVASASGGPALSYGFGVIALMLWRFRNHMRKIRWGIFFGLVALHMVMKGPVWYLMSKISDLVGGSGWHRAYLIDTAIQHFGEWWLLGATYTAHWMPYGIPNMPGKADITNQFIGEGVDGGLLSMILFITMIVLCFRQVGKRLRVLTDAPLGVRFTLWSLGAALFAHVMSFLGIGYFDQIIVAWFLLLSVIAAMTELQDNAEAPIQVDR